MRRLPSAILLAHRDSRRARSPKGPARLARHPRHDRHVARGFGTLLSRNRSESLQENELATRLHGPQLFLSTAGPAHAHVSYLVRARQAEVHARIIRRQEAPAKMKLSDLPHTFRHHRDTSTYGVTRALPADGQKPDSVGRASESIVWKVGGRIDVDDNAVDIAVLVEVAECDGTTQGQRGPSRRLDAQPAP